MSELEEAGLKGLLVNHFVECGLMIKAHGLNIIENIKPTHGNCCTCQTCGQSHEECVCSHNENVRFINMLFRGGKST